MQCLRLKYVLSRGVSQTGYRAANLAPTRIMSVQAFERDVRALHRGVKAQFCQWPLSSQAQLAGIKHLNRLDQVMASQELAVDVFEGITRDSQGIIVEGTMTNLFMRTEQGIWLTPSLATSGVAGVLRQCLLEQVFPALGEQVIEVQLRDFRGITELFVCNALIGVVPIVELDGQCFTISEDTLLIQSTINKKIHL
jgi:4-amino-4-deoxychorismate lyase